jgi:hypothetical protein
MLVLFRDVKVRRWRVTISPQEGVGAIVDQLIAKVRLSESERRVYRWLWSAMEKLFFLFFALFVDDYTAEVEWVVEI